MRPTAPLSHTNRLVPIWRHPRDSSSKLLAGTFIDPANGSTLLRLEAARRLGSSWRLEVEGTAFVGIEDDDPLFGLRRDHNLRLILEKHF